MTNTCLIDDLSRRGLLSGAEGSAIAARLGCRPLDREEPGAVRALQDDVAAAEPEEIASGVFFLKGATRYFQEGTVQGPAGAIRSLMCNNGWVVLGDYVLLIDANMPSRADTLIDAVRRTTDKPIRFLLNTHHHGDHMYGNRAIFERTGAAIVACTGMIEELRRYETGAFGGPPGRWEEVGKHRPDVAATPLMLPTQTFDDTMLLEGGGRRVELRHLGLGHTRGDAVAWLPEERVVFAGDLVTNGAFNIVRDSVMAPWIDTLSVMQALKPSVVCPGHGGRGDDVLLAHQRSFFVALLDEVKFRIQSCGSRDRVLGDLEAIRAALLADPTTASFVIPREADLAVLSLRAQVERVYDQMRSQNCL